MVKAKTLSLIAKILGVVYVIIGTIAFGLPATEAVIVGVFICEAFISVDVSMITKNVKNK